MSFNKRAKSGFTLIELLVVIAVIGILVGMLFPAIQAVRNAARRSSCLNNMRQVILSVHNYETSNGRYPKAVDANGGSLFLELCPFMDQEYIYQRSAADLAIGETWEDRYAEISTLPIPVLHCPATTEVMRFANLTTHGKFTTNYVGIAGPLGFAVSSDGSQTYTYKEVSPVPTGGSLGLDGIFAPHKGGKFSIKRGTNDIRDGASNTLVFGEISYQAARDDGSTAARAGWAFGGKLNSSTKVAQETYSVKAFDHGVNQYELGDVNNLSFGSVHSGGAHFSFADGSVKFINQKIKKDVVKTLCSIGRLEIPEDYQQ